MILMVVHGFSNKSRVIHFIRQSSISVELGYWEVIHSCNTYDFFLFSAVALADEGPAKVQIIAIQGTKNSSTNTWMSAFVLWVTSFKNRSGTVVPFKYPISIATYHQKTVSNACVTTRHSHGSSPPSSTRVKMANAARVMLDSVKGTIRTSCTSGPWSKNFPTAQKGEQYRKLHHGQDLAAYSPAKNSNRPRKVMKPLKIFPGIASII